MTSSFDTLHSGIEKALSDMQPLDIYEQSLTLLRKTEDRLAKTSVRSWVPESISRSVVIPLFLFGRGFEQLLSGFWTAFGFAWLTTFLGDISTQYLPIYLASYAIYISLFLAIVIVLLYMFAAPSTYCISGVNGKHIQAVTSCLGTLKITNEKMLETITRNISVFEDRIKRRLAGYRWAVGIFWSIYFAPTIGKLTGATGQPIGIVTTTDLLIPIGLIMLFFFIVDCYSRGVDIVFRAIELGCTQYKAYLLRENLGGDKPKT